MKKIIVVIMALAVVLCSSVFAFATDSAIKAPVLEKVEITSKRVSAENSNGLKAVILGMIGDYETVITDYTYNNGSYTSHSISIERDYAWIWSAILLVVVMYCVFRAIGGIICK